MKGSNLREVDGETEKYCPVCREWWPADEEFFYFSKGRLQYTCKACSNERRTAQNVVAKQKEANTSRA
jgi:hypothetical protein